MTGPAEVSPALRIATLKTLSDAVSGPLTGGKADLLAEMRAGDIEKVTARLPDGTKVASLPVCGGEPSPRVTDHAAFLKWVLANRPGEIEQVVRDSYVKAVLAEAKRAGRPVDPKSGEIIPGIEFAPTTPYVSVNFTKDGIGGRELIARAWRDGAISLPELLALPAGESEPAS